jgi:hypothetical protein
MDVILSDQLGLLTQVLKIKWHKDSEVYEM